MGKDQDWLSLEEELRKEAEEAQLDDRVLYDFEAGKRFHVSLRDQTTGEEMVIRANLASALNANVLKEWLLRWKERDDVVMISEQYQT